MKAGEGIHGRIRRYYRQARGAFDYGVGLRLYYGGKFLRAGQHLERAYLLDPNRRDRSLLSVLAQCYTAQRRHEESLKFFSMAHPMYADCAKTGRCPEIGLEEIRSFYTAYMEALRNAGHEAGISRLESELASFEGKIGQNTR